jgi:hypothetical protein
VAHRRGTPGTLPGVRRGPEYGLARQRPEPQRCPRKRDASHPVRPGRRRDHRPDAGPRWRPVRAAADPAECLARLQALRDRGVLAEAEYDARSQKIISAI